MAVSAADGPTEVLLAAAGRVVDATFESMQGYLVAAGSRSCCRGATVSRKLRWVVGKQMLVLAWVEAGLSVAAYQ